MKKLMFPFQKYKSLITLMSALFIVYLCFAVCFITVFHSPSKRFQSLCEDLFLQEVTANTINLHYTLAYPENFDIKKYPVTLGEFSVQKNGAGAMPAENYFNRLKDIPRGSLKTSERLTYDILSEYLENVISVGDLALYPEILSPASGIQTELPILLAEYIFRTERDIKDYLTLLTCIPNYIQSAFDYQAAKSDAGLFMSDSSVEQIIAQCSSFIDTSDSHFLAKTFQSRIENLTFLDSDKKQKYIRQNSEYLKAYVYPSYQKFITDIASLKKTGKNTGGLCQFKDGRRYYEYLVKSNTGSSKTVPELREKLEKRFNSDYQALISLVQNNLSEAMETSSASKGSFQSPESMLEDLKIKITKDFPELPENSYTVKYVDQSLEKYLSPAFYLTPAIDDTTENVIYINQASQHSDLGLYTTLAHEGYPGHLYQTLYTINAAGDLTSSNLLRNLLYHGGYVEGWALYVEMYSYDLADVNPVVSEIQRLDQSIQLCIYSLLDIGIHYDGWSLEQVQQYLSQLGEFDSETTKYIYQYIVNTPSNYLKYYIGYLEICDLRSAAKNALGDKFSLKEFHDFLLSVGPAPFDIIKERQDTWISGLLS